MKTPPVENSTKQEDKNNYLYGDKILFGFPKRTFFELYAGSCSSDKIYSVQTKDFPKDIAAVVYYPEDNVNIDLHRFADREHIFVEYSSDLANLLKKNGVESKNAAFINPVAFEWMSLEDVEEDAEPEVNQEESTKKKSNKNKAIIAALIAALSLLN